MQLNHIIDSLKPYIDIGKKYKYQLGFLLMLIIQMYLISYDIDSIKFIARISFFIFISLVVNLAFFITLWIFIKPKDFYKCAFYSLLLTNFITYLLNLNHFITDYIGRLVAELVVNKIIPIKFIQIASDSNGFFYFMMIALYASIYVFCYGNWIVKHKKINDGFWKIERQVIYTGLGLYGILIPLVFIFTHFTFVGSSFIYMEGSIKYTDKIIDFYDKKQQKNDFFIKDLKYFNTLDEAYLYYTKKSYYTKANISGNKEIIEYYDTFIHNLSDINKNGFSYKKITTYDNMTTFNDWMQVAHNLNFHGTDIKNNKYWHLQVIEPVFRSNNPEDLLRICTSYIKKSSHGGYYIYYKLDREFKNYKMNEIYNTFFIAFHFIYLFLYFYLIRIHQKHRLDKER